MLLILNSYYYSLNRNNMLFKNNKFIYNIILNPIKIFTRFYVFSTFAEDNICRILVYYENSTSINSFYKYFRINGYNRKIKVINYRGVHDYYYNILFSMPNYIDSNYLQINNKSVFINNRIYNRIIRKYKLLFCLTTLFDYNRTDRFIEFVEYYKYFGVDKFVVYVTNCSTEIQDTLLYYKSKHVMDIIFDNFTHNIYEKKRFHVWKQNDCFFRYKSFSENMIFTDHDEIIYSPIYKTSKDLLSHINSKASSYHFYPLLTITNGKGFFYSNNYSLCPNVSWKFIIKRSSCVDQVVVHDVIMKSNSSCFRKIIKPDIGYVLHARNSHSRHSKLCKIWKYISYDNDRKKLNSILLNAINL